MINVGIINIDVQFLQKQSVFSFVNQQESILSPFLFNIYMTEFDCFLRKKNRNFPLKMNYETNFHTDFNNQVLIQYVRYGDNLLFGIVGSKKLAIEIQRNINGFLKNLHLKVDRNKLVHRDDNKVNFLKFDILLTKFHKKYKIKCKDLVSFDKSKRKLYAKMAHSSAKMAKAAVANTKKNMVKTFIKIAKQTNFSKGVINEIYKGKQIKNTDFHSFNTGIWKTMTESLINSKRRWKLIDCLNYKKFQNNKWIQHYQNLYEKEMFMSLKYCQKIFENSGPNLDLQTENDSNICNEVEELKRKFVQDLQDIEDNHYWKFFEERQLLSKTHRSFLKKYKYDLEPAANILTKSKKFLEKNSVFSKENVREIRIMAPIKDLIDMLIVKGFFHPVKRKPIGNLVLCKLKDCDIVRYYSKLMYTLIRYYLPADNLNSLKKLIENLRISFHFTMAIRYKKTIS